MKLNLEIDIRPYLRMWKSKDNGTSNKKVMKKFYELFAQPFLYRKEKQRESQKNWTGMTFLFEVYDKPIWA